MMFAAWSRRDGSAASATAVAPALLAGLLWPLVAAGLVQWLLIHLLAGVLAPARAH